MPELPEVETIRLGLIKTLQGAIIKTAHFTLPRLLLGITAKILSKNVEGQAIQKVLRRGKYLILELERDSVVFHLGMTGQITVISSDSHSLDKHIHAVFELDQNGYLQFRDPRTFGKIFFIHGHEWAQHPRLKILGPEPLELKIDEFLNQGSPLRSQRGIKSVLLDQHFLAGVGNIYADEALYAAKIHPLRSTSSLSIIEWQRLLKAIQFVLLKGIENSGTTFSDYRQPNGKMGDNSKDLQAYGRGNKPCGQCKSILQKIVVAQRGTVFCPHCQPRNLGGLGGAGKRRANPIKIFSKSRMDKAKSGKHT